LLFVLLNSLILLHPFIPFITEEIYQKLPIKNKKKSLMIENWP
jgi:valyl-tRNA synthetase